MIDKVEFIAKNLTSNAGVLLLLNYVEEQRIFQDFDEMLVFDNKSTEAIKVNYLKTLICGGLVGADKLERFLRDINFRTFKKLLKENKLRKIVIDLDSRAVNVEGNQEGAVKGYNPHHKGNNCYNLLMAFCDELKALSVLEIHTPLMVLPKG